MRLDPKPARTTERCKIKAVNPPFRSVSTPRRTKDLPVVAPVNPAAAPRLPQRPSSASEWSAERLTERLRIELGPGAWRRLEGAAGRVRGSVEQLLQRGLLEVA